MLALIVTNFPEGAPRIKALSIFTAVSSAGGSIGLLLGGMLTSWGSWRLVMYVNVPIGLGAAYFAARLLRESPRQQGGNFDIGGALTSILGMTSLVYGFINAAAKGWGDTVTIASFAAAAVLIVSFVLIERRAQHPVVPLQLLKDGPRARGYVSVLLIPAAMFGMFFFITQFMQKVLHFSPVKAGLAFLPMTLLLFTMSRFVPRLLPRFGARPLVLIGTALLSSGLLWMSFITPETKYLSGLFIPMLLFGIGAGLAFGPLSVTILSGLRPQDSGAASGLMQASQQTGGALGLSVLVSVFGATQRNGLSAVKTAHDAAKHYTHGLGLALLVAALFSVTAFIIALTLRQRAAAPVTDAIPAQATDAVPAQATAEV
jgi:MFS family permease